MSKGMDSSMYACRRLSLLNTIRFQNVIVMPGAADTVAFSAGLVATMTNDIRPMRLEDNLGGRLRRRKR
jgi:hypothetical protein